MSNLRQPPPLLKLKGLDTITFRHPKEFGKEQLFGSYTPCQIINNSFVVKGIVYGKWTQKPEGSDNWVVEGYTLVLFPVVGGNGACSSFPKSDTEDTIFRHGYYSCE